MNPHLFTLAWVITSPPSPIAVNLRHFARKFFVQEGALGQKGKKARGQEGKRKVTKKGCKGTLI
jgi:hypothetical protein